MARVALNKAQLISEVRILLREPNEEDSGWTNDELSGCLNRCMSRRDMQLQATGEGYGITVHDTDLVEDQEDYEIPTQGARVHRVLRYVAQDGVRIPLEREEHIDKPNYLNNGVFGTFFNSETYLPTYRLVDNFILLSPPPPTDIDDGLRIELESPADRLIENTDTLPDAWPLFIEDLLIYDTAVEAYNLEMAISPTQEQNLHSLARSRQEYEAAFMLYIQERNHSPSYLEGWAGVA